MASSNLPAPTPSSAPIDIRRVKRLFAHPGHCAESQFLRREIAQRMHERLGLIKISPAMMIDAGCGEGGDLAPLQSRFPQAQLLGLDASLPMLAAARQRRFEALGAMKRLLAKWMPRTEIAGAAAPMLTVGDFSQMPLASGSADLVWSNLALHWHPNPDRVFAEWRRVLRVDGLLMFSCFGPDTFKELRTAFAAIDANPATLSASTLPFVDMHDFGDMLVHAGFATPVMDMETISVTYRTPDKLLSDVRAWGGNPLANRRRGLIGRAAWQRMLQALERQRNADGTIKLSFEVIYGHAFRPVQRTTAAGETIVRLDLRKKP